MVTLQQPRVLYCRGAVRPWDEGVVHVSSEAMIRGLNVFEGIKGYWQQDGSMGVIALRAHYDRLKQSAKLLHFPFEMTFEAFEDAVHELFEALREPDKNIWVRATLFMIEGHWGQDQVADLVMTAYQSPTNRPKPVTVGISTWKRASDNTLPARVKTSTNYQASRLARIEGRSRGYGEMILLNQYDRVAETSGSSVIIVRDGVVATPCPSEGALESITVNIVEALCESNDIPFERRPVERTELHIADEIALVGSLAEITPVSSVDEYACAEPYPVLDKLSNAFFDAVTGKAVHSIIAPSCRHYS